MILMITVLLAKKSIMSEASTPLLKNLENRISATKVNSPGTENDSPNASREELQEQREEKIKEEFILGLEEWLCCSITCIRIF